jgi:tRNA(Ile)-lysidine synthase
MNVGVPAGRYILAVSGGVDSMVLLNLLVKKPELELVVAHYNHNIRGDSVKDEELVKQTAQRHGLSFELGKGRLEANSSEETARNARYGFLEAVRLKHGAAKIITAHHQDDLIETAFINLIRGTGRQGLSAMANNPGVLRPLLGIPKIKIIKYATKHGIEWREDSTNKSIDYLRNNLRLRVLSRLTDEQRRILIKNLDKVAKLNVKIDDELATLSHIGNASTVQRDSFSSLPIEVSNELVAFLLRKSKINDYDSATIHRLNMAIRTAKAGSSHSIKSNFKLKLSQESATVVTP